MHPFKKMILSLVSEYLTLTQYCYEGIWEAADTIHVPPGGHINYQDEFGIAQSVNGIVLEDGIISVYSSIEPTIFGVTVTACPIPV